MSFLRVIEHMSMISYDTKLIFKSEEDRQKVFDMLQASNLVWNECSKIKFEKTLKNSIVDIHAAFYRQFRDKHPEIPAQIVIIAENSVLAAYRAVKSCKHQISESCLKNRLSILLDDRSFASKRIDGIPNFSIISLKKRVKCQPYIYPKLKEYLDKYKFSPPVIFVKNKEICANFTFHIQDGPVKNDLAVGIDLGVRVFAATSDGNIYIDRKFNKEKRKLRYLKRCLQSQKKVSKSAKRHLRKIRHKERNRNKNFSIHLANKIIKDTKADTLVVEDLTGLKIKREKFANINRLSQIPFFQLKRILTYKAPLAGKTVIQVSPYYTSQIDSKTGLRDGERKGRRYYSKSGEVYDADVNAAINIAKRSKLPNSCGDVLDGQAIVNSPIVGRKANNAGGSSLVNR